MLNIKELSERGKPKKPTDEKNVHCVAETANYLVRAVLHNVPHTTTLMALHERADTVRVLYVRTGFPGTAAGVA